MAHGSKTKNLIQFVSAIILLTFGSFLITSAIKLENSKRNQVGGASTIQEITNVYNKKVYVLIYNPVFDDGQKLSKYMNWKDPDTLVSQYIEWLKTTTNNKLNISVETRNEIQDFPILSDGREYDQETYLACWKSSSKCFVDTLGLKLGMDYNMALKKFGICEYFNSKTIDEVWILGAPNMGIAENVQTRNKSSIDKIISITGSSCNSPMNIMGFNYEKGISNTILNQEESKIIDISYEKSLYEIGQGALGSISLGLGVFLMIKFTKKV